MNNKPITAIAFTRCDNGRDSLEELTPTMGCGSNHSAHLAVAHAFYSTGGSHGLDSQPELSPPIKVGSALGIPSPPAVAFQPRYYTRSNKTGGQPTAIAATLEAGKRNQDSQQCVVSIGCLTPELPQRVRVYGVGGTSPTLSSEHGRGHGVPSVLAPTDAVQVCPTLRAGGNRTGGDRPPGTDVDTADSLIPVAAAGHVQPVSLHENQRSEVSLNQTTGSVKCAGGKPGQGYPAVMVGAPTDAVQVQWASGGGQLENPTAQALRSGAEHNYQFLRQSMAVRRLTPKECERLQGFPDDHTLIEWRGKSADLCPDGPRYKALGNSMAVPCMAWIGKRIAAQESGPLRYLSVCSGIEAASVAWEPLGWKPAGFSEIEKFPSAVLAHHWPDVPNLGDMTKYEEWNLGTIDLLVGGTPCQSFSVAGLRKGLRDPRGGLMLTYLEIARRFRPRWLVWENVPGVLSSHGGRDFGAFLGALGDLGYGWSYRVLDAQWFGVAQRRRRVFVVANLGDGDGPAKVLFERESVLRNPAPSRETGERTSVDVAPGLTASGRGVGRTGESRGQDPVIAVQTAIAGSLSARDAKGFDRGDMHQLSKLVPQTVGALTDGAHQGGA